MKTIKRYIFLLICILIVYSFYYAILTIIHHGCYSTKTAIDQFDQKPIQINITKLQWNNNSYYKLEQLLHDNSGKTKDEAMFNHTNLNCRMDSHCFDFFRCPIGTDLKIYIYPYDEQHTSTLFRRIVNFIKHTKYYEPDPDKGL